ncbi:MAG TPA: prolyl-tRNA synthetase [Candidatus Moranbacteria bacterium]|nr:prolyl-tRNA synthetase [Candidatus Moranbacteria bacterium]
MYQSKLFTKTTKNISQEEQSRNAQLLVRGGFVDRLTAGVYSFLPLGLRVMKKIENIIREEMNKVDGQEIFMPALCPRENYDKTDRYEILAGDILFHAESKHTKNLVLNQSHEEVITPLMKKFVSSYKDLPLAVYQFQDKFRAEPRPKSGVLRGREFIMKDLYSFHISQDDLDIYYDKVTDAYRRIFDRSGVGKETYLTYASGGSFSKYSHEFQTLTEAGEDIIYLCRDCQVAVNKEIIEDQAGKCPLCAKEELEQLKSAEVGNIFKLGTRFSDSFNLTVLNEKGESSPVIMGCYGIGLQRLMGTIVEIFNDDKGIIWPEAVAPFKVHLISLDQNENANKLYQKLIEAGVEVLFDDRESVGAGQKFAEADLIGCPWRVVLSQKTTTAGQVEIKSRGDEKVEYITEEALVKKLLG